MQFCECGNEINQYSECEVCLEAAQAAYAKATREAQEQREWARLQKWNDEALYDALFKFGSERLEKGTTNYRNSESEYIPF